MQDSELSKILMDWAAVFLRLSMRDFNRHTRRIGLSLAQMNVLMHLYSKGPTEVMEFTTALQLSPAGASQLVNRMAKQGLVKREEYLGDRRVRVIHLTEYGREIIVQSISARCTWMEGLMSAFSAEQKQAVGEALKLLTETAQVVER